MNNPLHGSNSIWWKIAVIAAPLIVSGVIASIRVSDQVESLRVEVGRKADQDVMTANQEAILRELNQLQKKIDDLSIQHLSIPRGRP